MTMLSLLLLSLQAQPISLAPGFYTYGELGAVLNKAGVKVEVASSLENRAGYISLSPRNWEQMKKPLETGLSIRFLPNGEKLLMSPDEATLQKQRAMLKACCRIYESHVRSVFSEGLAKYDKIKQSDPAEHGAILTTVGPKSNAAINSLASRLAVWMMYDQADADMIEIVLQNLQFERHAEKMSIFESSLSQAFSKGRFKRRPTLVTSMFAPLQIMDDQAKQRELLDNMILFDRMIFDPETGVLAFATDWHHSTQWLEGTLRKNLVPEWARPRIKLSDLQSPDEAKAYETRQKESESVLSVLPAKPLTKQMGAISHNASQFARENKLNLVLEVSAFGDTTPALNASESFAKYIARINQATTGTADFAKLVQEISPDPTSYLPSEEAALRTVMTPFRAWSLKSVDGVLILQNELGFLDLFAQGPRIMSSDLEALLANGARPTFAQLGDAASKVSWGKLQSPTISQGLRRYPRPWQWAPFARTYAEDEAFRKLIDGIKVNEPFPMPFNQLGAGTKAKLIKYMRESSRGSIAHGVPPFTSPTFAALPAFETELNKASFEIVHAEGNGQCTYGFVLRGLPTRILWSATIENLQIER